MNPKILMLLIGRDVEIEYENGEAISGLLLYVDVDSFAIKTTNKVFTYSKLDPMLSISTVMDDKFMEKWTANSSSFLEDMRESVE